MFNGRMGGKGFVAYNQGVAILVGIIFVAFGVALLVGAFHLGSHH
jgi:hypothetical protein